MPYAFEKHEPLSAAIPRIMNEQLVRVREHLTGSGPIDERVHDARKRFKESRALLRMARQPLGAQFDVENAWFRDAGRNLSAARDADAVLEALAKLKLTRTLRDRARTLLEQRRHAPDDLEQPIATLLDQLVVAQARISIWPPLGDSFDTIGSGLRRTYRDGRRAMNHSGMPHELHEWRKRVKEHWYHMQLLRDVWPPMMKASAGVLSDLSHALGDHHDLFVLRQIIAESPDAFGPRRSLVKLLDTIEAKQRDLESDANTLGARIYAERPKAWLARMWKYWSAWQK